MIATARLAHVVFLTFFAVGAATAESNPGFGVGNIHEGLVVGAIVGVGAVAGLGITYLVVHNRGVVVGCVTEPGGAKTLAAGKNVYTLPDTGPSLPVGDRVKVKGHKSGRSFQVEKVIKDYGPCQH